MSLTVEMYEPEIAEALTSFDRFVVCLAKTPDECKGSMASLMAKAINAYQGRAPGLRHGIALDQQLTIILSQNGTDRPSCAIYFNLSSPYHRQKVADSVPAGTAKVRE